MSKEERLRALNEEIKNVDFPLRKTCKQVVPGAGSANAQIMFIGEAPGAKEDDQGVPFVGPAGKFLDVLLESIDLKREDVFITNMVKCRPPDNRDPLPEEIERGKPWLDKQIEIIDPKVFVPLGRFALNKFVPGVKIGEAHGTAHKRGGKIYFAMYHPAVALYNGSYREVLLADMKKLQKILNGDLEAENLDKGVEDIKKKLQSAKKPSQIGMEI